MAPTKKQTAYEQKAIDLLKERDDLTNKLDVALRENVTLKADAERYERILKNPFALLKEFVPDLDLDADGTFDILSLTVEERQSHYKEIRSIYNSLAFNREVSAMVQGLQHFALCLPESSVEGFKTARQCIAFVKGMVDRFKQLAIQVDASTAKKPKTIDRNTPIG